MVVVGGFYWLLALLSIFAAVIDARLIQRTISIFGVILFAVLAWRSCTNAAQLLNEALADPANRGGQSEYRFPRAS
jgi:hypothetical protein